MENYVIYDELDSDNYGVIYKGRRKGTIDFVSVHCIDKKNRAYVTNAVRLLHSLEHSNILKFHEWYETSNHLWVVSEILSGGSLAEIIVQDHHLPEKVVRDFGIEICKGLLYLHQNSVIYAKLSPSSVSLDYQARPKLVDFSLARLLDEDLDVLFAQVSPKSSAEPSNISVPDAFLSDPEMVSPEVLESEHPGGPYSMTMAADIWGLGICLYQMYTGQVPFKGDTANEVLHQIHKKPFKIPESSQKEEKPSAEFLDLLKGLLNVELDERISWPEIISHPFWGGKLEEDVLENNEGAEPYARDKTIEGEADSLEERVQHLHSEILLQHEDETQVVQNPSDEIKPMRCLTRPQQDVPHAVHEGIEGENDKSQLSLTDLDTLTLSGRVSPTSPSKPIEGNDCLFRLSCTHSQLPMSRNASPSKKMPNVIEEDDLENDDSDLELIYHPSDVSISLPFPDPPKGGSIKYDAQLMPIKVLNPLKLLTASSESIDAAFNIIKTFLVAAPPAGQGKSQFAQKQMSVLSYFISLISNNQQGEFVPFQFMGKHQDVLTLLVQLIHSNVTEDSVRQQSAFVLAALAFEASQNFEKFPGSFTVDLHKLLLTLSEVVRDGTTSKPLRTQCLVSLLNIFIVWGKLLHFSKMPPSSPFPSLALTVVCHNLRGEASSKDELRSVSSSVRIVLVLSATMNEIKRKRLNVAQDVIQALESKLLTPDLTQNLWTIVSRCQDVNLRSLAMATLISISRTDVSVLHACLDRAGLSSVIGILSGDHQKNSSRDAKNSSNNCQFHQLSATVLCILLHHPPNLHKISQSKDLLKHLLHLNENPSTILRAKVWLALKAIMTCSRDAFNFCCKGRLISMVDREIKQIGPSWNTREDDHGSTWKRDPKIYLLVCLNQFVHQIRSLSNDVVKDAADVLREVSGRKHPSANQSLRLKNSLPHLHPFYTVLSSGTLRPVVLQESLILHHLIGILNETPSVNSKETNLDPSLGSGQSEEMVKVVLSLFEVISVSTQIFSPKDEHSPSSSTNSSKPVQFEKTASFDLLMEGVLPSLVAMVLPCSSSTPHVLRLLTHLLSPMMAEPSPLLQTFIVDRLLSSLAFVISASEPSSHNLVSSLGLGLLHILLALSPHPLDPVYIPDETQIAIANAARDVIGYHVSQKHMMTPIVNQALAIIDALLSSCSHSSSITSLSKFPSLWSHVHHEWNLVSFIVVTLKAADLEPQDLECMEKPVAHQFVEALLHLLQTIIQFVSDRIRFVLTSRRAGKQVDTDAAESLLLHHRPLIRAISPLLHYLMVSSDPDLATSAISSLSQLAQLFGGEHHPQLSLKQLHLYSQVLMSSSPSPDQRRSSQGHQKRMILRTLKRLLLVGAGDGKKSKRLTQAVSLFREDHEVNSSSSLFSVLSLMCEVAASHADVAEASTAQEIIDAMQSF